MLIMEILSVVFLFTCLVISIVFTVTAFKDDESEVFLKNLVVIIACTVLLGVLVITRLM